MSCKHNAIHKMVKVKTVSAANIVPYTDLPVCLLVVYAALVPSREQTFVNCVCVSNKQTHYRGVQL